MPKVFLGRDESYEYYIISDPVEYAPYNKKFAIDTPQKLIDRYERAKVEWRSIQEEIEKLQKR